MAFNLNPQYYQALPPGHAVDWAAIAQQWIQMRETLPPDQLHTLPDAPPPPMISSFMPMPVRMPVPVAQPRIVDQEEKGEAPMEMDEADIPAPPPAPIVSGSSFSPPPRQHHQHSSREREPREPWRNPPWQAWENHGNQRGNQPPPLIPELQGYTASRGKRRAAAPVVEPVAPPVEEKEPEVLDAAKRKKLPAWIREGLEKMEREKLREVERAKEEEERKKQLEEKKRLEALALQEMEQTNFLKSKFESDAENEEEVEPPVSVAPTRSPTPELKSVSWEEKTQEMMLAVRKALTEILLEVTNEEIQSIALEVCSRYKPRVNRAQPLRKTALSSITGGLGLGIYGDSSGESSEDEDARNRESDAEKSDKDSEEELKVAVSQKKKEFALMSEKIEKYLEQEEASEQLRQREWDRRHGIRVVEGPAESSDSDSSESKPDAKDGEHEPNDTKSFPKSGPASFPRGSSKKTSRFSDPCDNVRNKQLTHINLMTAPDFESPSSVQTANVRLDLNQFLRREIELPAVKKRSSSSSSSSSERSKKKRSKGGKKKKSSKSKKRRRRSSSSSSESSRSSKSTRSSLSDRRKRRREHRRTSEKRSSRRRTRSRSRDSRRSGRSSYRSRSRDRGRARY